MSLALAASPTVSPERTLADDPLAPASAAIGVCLALMLPCLVALGVDGRTIGDAPVWAKPLKFEVSIALHFATLIALAPLAAASALSGRLFRWTLLAAGVAGVGEILYICLQAARGRASHFNLDTPIEAAMYPVMGAGAVIIVLAAAVLGWLVWRHPSARPVGAGLRLGTILGLLIGSALTLVLAGYLSSGAGHHVGTAAAGAAQVPLVGWSAAVGDLRVAHFVATHLMQALPIAGLVADRLVPHLARPVVWAATAAGVVLALAAFAQALAGLPLVAL